jgi:hypothetical protein
MTDGITTLTNQNRSKGLQLQFLQLRTLELCLLATVSGGNPSVAACFQRNGPAIH